MLYVYRTTMTLKAFDCAIKGAVQLYTYASTKEKENASKEAEKLQG